MPSLVRRNTSIRTLQLVRIAVLFREPPPSAIAPTVQTMRWVYGINLGMFVGFIGCLLISLLAHTV